jgi:hypothetical protein
MLKEKTTWTQKTFVILRKYVEYLLVIHFVNSLLTESSFVCCISLCFAQRGQHYSHSVINGLIRVSSRNGDGVCLSDQFMAGIVWDSKQSLPSMGTIISH